MIRRYVCLICKRPITRCECPDVCKRCGYPDRKCMCERGLRPELYERQDDKFQPDEEIEDALRREYGSDEEKSDVYWHGYNTCRKMGTWRRFIPCPKRYRNEERHEFYRGVSDARSRG